MTSGTAMFRQAVSFMLRRFYFLAFLLPFLCAGAAHADQWTPCLVPNPVSITTANPEPTVYLLGGGAPNVTSGGNTCDLYTLGLFPSSTTPEMFPTEFYTFTVRGTSGAMYTFNYLACNNDSPPSGCNNGSYSYSTYYGITVTGATVTTDTVTVYIDPTASGSPTQPITLTVNISTTTDTGPTASVAIASQTLTENHASASFTPVTASGGIAPLSYSVSPSLPTNLSMSSTTGAITGTPTVTHTSSSFTVTVTDADSKTSTASFDLAVNSAVTATQAIATKTLTEGVAATAFTPVTGGGGTAPLVYSVFPALPTNLSISSTTGAITGTPTVTSTGASYAVTITDANGATGSASFNLTVIPPAPTVTSISPTSGTTTGGTTVTIGGTNFIGSATVAFGTNPATAVTIINPTSMTATSPAGTAGVVNVTVTTAGGTSPTSSADDFTYIAPVTVSTAALTSGTVGVAYSESLSASGGTSSSYTYSISAGTLPTGLGMSSSGTISGTPSVGGSFPLTFKAIDSGNNSGTAPYTLVIAAGTPAISWTPAMTSTYTGIALGSSVLNATSTAPGTFTYTATPSGGSASTVTAATVLAAGTYTLTANFTPTTPANYNTASSTSPFTVAIEHVWVANGNGTISSLDAGGNAVNSSASTGGKFGIAIDSAGSIWSVNSSGLTLSELTKTGSVTSNTYTGGGLNSGAAVAIDGADHVWIANGNSSFSLFTNAGVAIAPSGGFTGGLLSTPTGIAIDISGSVWISNSGNNSVTRVLGAAAPAAPLVTGTTNSTLGAKP